MSILTMADYAAAAKQTVHLNKQLSGFVIAGAWQNAWNDASGDPGVGSFTLTSTAAGNVPTSATAGAPTINAFSGIGYISRVDAVGGGTSPSSIMVVDRLFECGSYAWNAGTVTLSGQPSYSGRIPGGDYTGTMIVLEQGATIGNGPASVVITYTDQAGNTGHTTPSYTLKLAGGGAAGGYVQQVPLAAGDCGVQKIESIALTGGSSGNINVLVLRPLIRLNFPSGSTQANFQVNLVRGIESNGMKRVYSDSCLMVLGACSLTPTTDISIEIASG